MPTERVLSDEVMDAGRGRRNEKMGEAAHVHFSLKIYCGRHQTVP